MNFQDKKTKDTVRYAFFIIIMPIIISTLLSDKITATDWVYRHSMWIDRYLRGDFTPIFEYPPLFHWMMLPFVAINFPVKYFQILFIILSASGIFYYTYKEESEETLKNVSILLVTAIPFILFSGALMPQGLDYFLFPIALVFYFKNRIKITVFLLVIIFFMHIMGLIFVGVLLLHSLLTKRYKYAGIFFVMLLVLSPIFYYYQLGASSLNIVWNAQAQAEWESNFITPFWKFFATTGLLTWIYLPFALRNLPKKKFKFTDTQLLYIVWMAGFLSLAVFNAGIWRAMSYIIVPMSLFVASLVDKNEKQTDKKEI